MEMMDIEEGEEAMSPSTSFVAPSKDKRGCMMCVVEEPVRDFRELGPGDHVTMPGMVPVYKHHAIVHDVDKISQDGQMASVRVTDVTGKGKGNSYKPTFPVSTHQLCRKEAYLSGRKPDEPDSSGDKQIKLSASYLNPPVKQERLYKMSYRQRKYDEEETAKRADAYAGSVDGCGENDSLQYCFCCQNCEHFAATIVNGPDSLDRESPKHGISLQAQSCFLVILLAIIWVALSLFYVFDLTAYALLVKTDTDFNNTFLDKAVVNIFESYCLKKSEMRWIEDHKLTKITEICGKNSLSFPDSTDFNCEKSWKKCDWNIMFVFAAIILAMHVVTLLCYYLCLLRQERICMPCFLTTLFTFVSRVLVFVVIEAIRNALNSPIYDSISKEKTNKHLTRFILILMAAGGCLLVYSLASLVVKGTYCIVGICNEDIREYNRFVPWRGLLWVCSLCVSCCCKCCGRD